ncbi:hypothetical protein OG21DRAFT_551315 [Imleria badia]|nr:hypothetical protein OG21DRAFT_551315 [Imleria badia]
MTTSSSYSVSDEHELLRSFYIGINIENILYGIELLLYFKTIRILLSNRGAHKKSNVFYALFSSMMVFSITVWVATQAIFGQRMWLLDSGFPGGPFAYWKANLSVWYMDWSTVEVIILQLMTDALMIYRCRMIWNSFRVVIVPVILWLATLTLGVLVAWANSFPGEDFHTGLSDQLSLAYWSVSVFLNTTLTCMICYRVMRHGKMVQEHLGHEYASLYFAVVTIVVESVLPYTLSGIAFLVSLGVGSPTSSAFICVYFLMMCISPQMLILRVMIGSAWDNDTFGRPGGSTIKFSPGGISGSGSLLSDGCNVGVELKTLSDMYPPGGHGGV